MKKLLAVVSALAFSIISLPLFAAFEAHFINVTAKIENGLTVDTSPIEYGTVFPQEQLDRLVSVALSRSFQDEQRVDDVNYVIRQKPKCWSEREQKYGRVTEADGRFICADGGDFSALPLLCPYLSKHEVTTDGAADNDSAGINAFHGNPSFWTPTTTVATQVAGRLAKSEGDTTDNWKIDLRVPCFQGNCAQDWDDFVKQNNPTANSADYIQPIENEHKLFGCDLWVEVSGISTAADGIKTYCGDGIIQTPNDTGLGGPNSDGNEQCDTYDIAYQGQGYHCGTDCAISRCQLGQGRPCHIQTQDGILRGLQWCTDEGLWEDCSPSYLQNPFESSLEIHAVGPTSTAIGIGASLFNFRLSDNAPSPYEGTNFTHGPNEEIQIRRLKLTKTGTVTDDEITDLELVNLDTGNVLQTIDHLTSGMIEFNLPVDGSKPDFGVMVTGHSYGVLASLANSSVGKNLQLSLLGENDVDAFDYRNDIRVATVTSLNTFPIAGTVLTISP